VFEGLKIPSSFCAGFAEERGDPKDGVPERMVLVTFAGTKVTRVRADGRIKIHCFSGVGDYFREK